MKKESLIYSNYDSYENLYESAIETLLANDILDYTENDVYNEINFLDQIDFDDEYQRLTEFFDGKKLIIFGKIQRWNGYNNGFNVYDSFDECFQFATKDCDFIKLYDENGHFYITSSHHDGTNHYEIKILKDSAADYIDNWDYGYIPNDKRTSNDILKQLIKRHSTIPHFSKIVYGC